MKLASFLQKDNFFLKLVTFKLFMVKSKKPTSGFG